MNKKDIAIAFQQMIATGKIRDAYQKYISPQFRHHNAYFHGDRESLLKGMEENAKQYPNKMLEVKRALEDGDMVAVHSQLTLAPDMPKIATIHIFRFEGDMIAEEWDIAQQVPTDSPNENGVF